MQKNIKNTLSITLVGISTQFFNFIINIISAKTFGASIIMDNYFIALTIPILFLTIISAGFGNVLIPKIVSNSSEIDNKKNNYAFSFLNLYIIVLVFITIIGVIFSREIIKLIFPDLSIFSLNTCVKLSYILWPSAFFSTVVTLISSVYQAKNNYIFYSLTALFSSFIYFVILYLFNDLQNIFILAYGMLISLFIQFLILFIDSYKYYVFKIPDLNDVKKFLILVSPIIIAVFFAQVIKFVDRSYASTLVAGSVTHIIYAEKIKMLFSLVLGNGFTIIIFPIFVNSFNNGGKIELFNKLLKSVDYLWIFIVPVICLSLFFSSEIVALLFERGSFSKEDTIGVSKVLPFYLFTLIGGLIGNITSSTLYTLKQTRIISYADIFGTILYLIYFPMLTAKYNIVGLGISNILYWSLGLFIHSIVLMKIFNKYNFFRFFFKKIIIFFSCVFCYTVIYFIYNLFPSNILVTLMFLLIAPLSYFSFLYFFKNSHLLTLIKNITN